MMEKAKGETSEPKNESEKAVSPEVTQLQDLYDLMVEEGLEAVELKDEESRIRLTRRGHGAWQSHMLHHVPMAAPAARAPSAPVPSSDAAASDQDAITSPLAGVFYRASSPTSAPFVKEGDVVDSGQTLCIVEAMKVMNEIKAEKRCKIGRIVAENSRPVNAGQPLFKVEPA